MTHREIAITKIPNDFTSDHKDTFNIETAATVLGISTATVRNWIKSGILPAYCKNNHYFFHKKDIQGVQSKLLKGKLEKLNKRANKTKATKTTIPKEHIKTQSDLDLLNLIVKFIKKNRINPKLSLFLLSLNLLKKEKILLKEQIQDALNEFKNFCSKGGKKNKRCKQDLDFLQKRDFLFSNKQIQEEMILWFLEIKKEKIKKHFSFLFVCELPKQRDFLGVLYQSLLFEGQKSRRGSYYTPKNQVDKIIKDYVKRDSRVLDPCCGTGQFLLAFSNIVKDPLNIYGVDCDRTAVQIARLNLLIRFKNRNFVPNIFCKNTLFDFRNNNPLHSQNSKNTKGFDVIATNPPWGGSFSKTQLKRLKESHPQITSGESFSYFLEKSLNWINSSGVVSFILPESILNVQTHKDIREILLKKTKIKKIIHLNRIFKNVFTPVIRMDFEKKNEKKDPTTIENKNKKYQIQQTKWISNHDFIFNIHCNKFDFRILDKLYKTNHINLKNKARWALGIVTGNNKKFIIPQKKTGFEPVYRGKDVKKFVLNTPSRYIRFQPDKFQQAAKEEKYRAKEKLIYRFISKNLVFAYDNSKSLTLNSANTLIPEIPDYPIKVIAALFNSSLYQFLFQKKFSSIKVLRNHIEDLPLPLWNKKTFSKIIQMVDKIIKNQNSFQDLDDYLMKRFPLSKKERKHINNTSVW